MNDIERRKMTAKRTGVLVLGMHDSGADAMAAVLGMLGCDLPPAKEGDGTANAIEAFDERLLADLGSSRHDWLPVNPGWRMSPPYQRQVSRGAKLVEDMFADSALFAIGDSRMSRLARFWLDVLAEAEADPAVVQVVGNPLGVAGSLWREGCLDPGYGHLLWLRSVLEAEAATRGCPRITCSIEQLSGESEALIDRASNALAISWPRRSPQVRAEIRRVLEDRPRSSADANRAVALDPSVSDWVRRTFAILARWTAQGEDASDHAALDAIRAEFDAVAPTFADWTVAVGRASAELATSRAQLREAQSQLARLDALVAERTGDLDEQRARLERSLQDSTGQTSALSEEVAQLRHRLAETESRLRQTQEEIAQAWAQLEEERSRGSRTAAAGEAVEARLRERLAESEAWVFRLAGERKKTENELHRVRARMVSIERERDAARRHAQDLGREALRIVQHPNARAKVAPAGPANAEADRHAGEQKLRSIEKRMADLVAGKADLEHRLGERHAELAAVTRLLADSEWAERRQQDDADWLLAVTIVLVSRPNWWFVLPPAMQRRRILRRVRRKGLFDADAYLARYPDVAHSGMDPLRHYIKHGWGENRINDARIAAS